MGDPNVLGGLKGAMDMYMRVIFFKGPKGAPESFKRGG